jgi:hypothetical protein
MGEEFYLKIQIFFFHNIPTPLERALFQLWCVDVDVLMSWVSVKIGVGWSLLTSMKGVYCRS